MIASIDEAERVGSAFSEDGMLAARQCTRTAIERIAEAVRPGMVEEDAVEHARRVLADMGLHATWHPVRVRFGANTMKAMKQPSVPGIVLKENDIFFVDIAPRREAWEGDGGASFVVGHDVQMERCARDAAIHSGSLAQAAFSPSPMRWVLEIHLRDPNGRFGAFFEDLLLEDRLYDR